MTVSSTEFFGSHRDPRRQGRGEEPARSSCGRLQCRFDGHSRRVGPPVAD
jgi:hypothetical protein